MKIKLTAALCRALACLPGQKKEVARCTELTGFGIEARASGKKTYYLYYTTPDGKAAQIRIGGYGDISFEAAKRKAQELRSRVVLGANPAAEKSTRRSTPRYAELARQHNAWTHVGNTSTPNAARG